MKEFEVGDKVWDIRYGNGVVTKVLPNLSFPVMAKFGEEWEKFTITYTVDGFSSTNQKNPMLYHGHDLQIIVKEVVYEYQVLFKKFDGNWGLSNEFYTSLDEFRRCTHSRDGMVLKFFEDSKREKV